MSLCALNECPLNIRQTRARQPLFFLVSFAPMNSVMQFRTLLVLGRVANLPTVWSNCLAGWWLGGGDNYWKLPFLLLGVSVLYTGGMFLNDAFDADFDRQRRLDRPIPSGKIPVRLVWKVGLGQLVAGILLLSFCSPLAAVAAFFLALLILLYNLSHRFFTASPWLMGACRFWVYIIAGATGVDGVTGWPIFCGAALALYVVGLNYVERRKSHHAPISYWALLSLSAPIVLAMTMNTGTFRLPAIWLALVLALWLARCARPVFMGGDVNISRLVSNLLAGIVFVDWLAVAPQCPQWLGIVFIALFGLTKWFQKFVPAA
jgi:4-hydroxybenzoate polyprenyltransferase